MLRSASMDARWRAPVRVLVVLAAAASAAHAGEPAGERLALDMSAAYRAPRPTEPAPEPAPPETPGVFDPPAAADDHHIPFGHAGSTWLTLGSTFAYDLGEEKDINLHAAYSHFIADELEFAVQLSGWYFAQDDEDTGGISGQMIFRWHFCHAEDWDWSIFGEAGIGLLAGFDDVPNGGQEFNFVPRAAAGFTKRLWDDSACRLQMGLGWHHISNGRYTGDVNNPSRDSVMVFAGIMIPF